MGDFYGTEIEIWARFGLVGITEKKIWADYEYFLRPVFSNFGGKKIKNIAYNRTKKLHKGPFLYYVRVF